MKKYIFVLFILSCFGQGFAQIKLPAKEPESKPPVKQTTTVKTTEAKSVSTIPMLTLKITTDTDCNFYVDGEYRGFVATDDVLKINLKKGDYQLKAVAADNPEKVIKQLYPVETTGIEKFYNIEFSKTLEAATRLETQNNVVVKTNTLTEPLKDAEVLITWYGPGSIKLYFDKEEYFFTEGQEKILEFKSENPYTLKAVKPDKTYNHNDYLGFEKGFQYYDFGFIDGLLVVEKSVSRSEKIVAYEQQRVSDYNSYMSYSTEMYNEAIKLYNSSGFLGLSQDEWSKIFELLSQAKQYYGKALLLTDDYSQKTLIENELKKIEKKESSFSKEKFSINGAAR